MSDKRSFKRIPNPYNPYDIKAGRSYYNKAVTNEIKREFEGHPPRKVIFIQGSEGSGKSSTFNRIIDEPDIIGNKYLPIYIHSNKIISGKPDVFLSNLYEIIKRNIDKYGIQLFDDPSESLKTKILLKDFYQLFSALEKKVKPSDSIILLIVDDFDNILELKDNHEQISEAIQFFRELSEKKDRIRIILGGRTDLHSSVRERAIDSYFDGVLTIKMKTLDTREFNDAITHPVMDWVSYSPEALEEIRKITGGNLYCQQLLCYYIIIHLNNEKKYNCTTEDVGSAADLAVMDVREDFNYFWEKLAVPDKLVCSAIMDENEVKKRGLYYFIDPSGLLSRVFTPEALNEILSRLHAYDFIIKINGRRFDDFPFKIPLYGNWINKEHPFIKTVVEHFDTIAKENDFISLGKIVEDLPIEMFRSDRKPIIEFLREWFILKKSLKENGSINPYQIEIPIQAFCKFLDLDIKESIRVSLEYFTIDFRKLNIGSIEEAFFIIQDRLEPAKDDIQHLRDMIMAHVNSMRPCLFFCLKKNDRIEELVKKTFLNIILIENNDLKNILFSSRPLQTLKEILFRRISSSQISPYQTDGPAIATFYGRNRELRKILGSTSRSFSVVGARKIGKSSLLARIKKELEDMGAYSLFMDLESPTNPDHQSFLQRSEIEIGRLLKTDLNFENNIDTFCSVLKSKLSPNKKLVFILDEIDDLLSYDKEKDFPLIRSFRSLFQEGYCQFILSGFEILQNMKRGIDSPFYNFCEEIPLGPLEKQFALDLITEPMANIGIGYDNPDDRELILEYTSNHPNLIQFFCKNLIEKLDENPDPVRRRIISYIDISELYDFQYENYVIDDFYMFYTDLNMLEKLIVIILIEIYPDESAFPIKFITQKLVENGIQLDEGLIHNTIRKLALRFILLDKGKGIYRFALPHFPGMLRERVEPEMKERLVRRIIEENALPMSN